ncbi:hypothetical protein [Terriglobus saanensis]|uniref:Uncharacterized protein n=1 Tax=Terriglobus saanensis (strain ATCC BAA-1853 / DSM 23119 / SP1PR4) TaxID=401053 RepID=E8V0L9_TERSS|nr:hypothetical protein [Terriglobus saanensis]ADV81082.1 hypothetical protein AciPR4_0244 [Terriglobus saanensis SP1PR4]
MQTILKRAAITSLFLLTLTLAAQERGTWKAESKTARSITGDLILTDEKLTISFSMIAMARIRGLQPEEIGSVFDVDSNEAGRGSLYRLNIPASKKFAHHNSLCGGEDVEWMVTYVSGKTMQVAFFGNVKVPVFDRNKIADSSNLCGTFTYAK